MGTIQDELLAKFGSIQISENMEDRFASAPYNFVTLPETIVPSPLDQSLDWDNMKEKERRNAYRKYILTEGTLSGRLELDIKTVTPCFIGGNGETFYAPNGMPVIPGSTLRGLTKNLLKIISCGAMRRNEDFYDRHLYFRDFTSENDANHTLKEYYRERMIKEVDIEVKNKDGTTVKNVDGTAVTVKKPRTKAEPGFLFKYKDGFYICPTQAKSVYNPDRCNKDKWGSIVWNQNGSVDIFTGEMGTKKTYFYFEKPVFSLEALEKDKYIKVPLEVKEEYEADKSRKGLNLFKKGKKGSAASGYTHLKGVTFVVPCYYTAQDYVAKHFGHGRYYRIAYDLSISDHVPKAMSGKTIDFADALFGKKEMWGSRLFFDDAKLRSKTEVLNLNYRLPLLQPNPTSFQLYLKQENEEEIKHWGEKAEIRGYKLYWHKEIKNTDWQLPAAQIEKQKKVTKKIQPIAQNTHFKGYIRFINLSNIELGALCKVFYLAEKGEDIVYKIGQGKSIGMGSVRITAHLVLEDNVMRYKSLFKENSWSIVEKTEDRKINDYCKEFQEYLNQKLTGQNRTRYELGMKELRTILNWKQVRKPNWREKTAMMNPTKNNDERLKDRVPLKDALSFVTARYKK